MKSITYIDLKSIHLSDFNPRKTIDENALKELAASIQEKGVIQPIVVRHEDEGYGIVCGERRFRASIIAGQKTIPAIIRKLTDDEALDLAISENLQRKDVNPLEEAAAFKFLIEKGQTIADLACRFGKSEMYVRGRLKLNDLIYSFGKLFYEGKLNISHCLELCKYPCDFQEKIFAEHYGHQYNNWMELSLNRLKSSLNMLMANVENAEFDKTECIKCPDNTAVSLLFPELESVCCKNPDCFSRKLIAYSIQKCQDIHDNHPDMVLFISGYGNYSDDPVVSYLIREEIPFLKEADGYSSIPEPRKPEKPSTEEFETEEDYNEALVEFEGELKSYEEDLKAFNEKIAEGKCKKAYCFQGYHRGDIVYIKSIRSSDKVEDDPKGAAIQELKNKDKRNLGISFEKTLDECKNHFRTALNKNECVAPMTELEENMVYFSMLDSLSDVHRQEFKGEKCFWLDDDVKFAIIDSLTTERKMVILRDFIMKHIADSVNTKSRKGEWVIELIRSYFPEKVTEIELAHKETYLQRKEKIDAKIAAIELGEIDNQ